MSQEQNAINLAAIFAHSAFSPRMKVFFSGGAIIKLGKYLVYFGKIGVSRI